MSEGRHHHVTVALEAWLQKSDRDLTDVFVKDGKTVPPQEARLMLAEAYVRGYTVLPICDNPDSRGYCAGHPMEKCSGNRNG